MPVSFYFKNTLNSQGARKQIYRLGPKSSSHTTVIMQFEFPLIFVRNFACLLGKLQTKSMNLIRNSISPEQQRPFLVHCTMDVYVVVPFVHVHVALTLLPSLVEQDICKTYVQCILLLCLTMLKLFIAPGALCDDYVTCYIT